ncbi:MAG: CAP domain-containing protein [Sneathiella sp.]|nr:CAP domain-containing protein [Sneathiella sp.]
MNKLKDLLDLINDIRAENNTPPLISNSELNHAAEMHAAYMLQNNILSHTGRKGSSFDERIKDTGYSFLSAAENVAFGAATEKRVFKLWIDSPPHKENILNPTFTEIGIGVAPELETSSNNADRYWSLSFAKPVPQVEKGSGSILVAEPISVVPNPIKDPF